MTPPQPPSAADAARTRAPSEPPPEPSPSEPRPEPPFESPPSAPSPSEQRPEPVNGASATRSGLCRVHLVAANPHELVAGGVPLADARLLSLDDDARIWLEECKARHAIFVVPAAGEEAREAGGELDRPSRTVVVSSAEYRSLLGLRPR
jgi:hypothetical protein